MEALDYEPKDLALLNDDLLLEGFLEDDLLLLSDPFLTGTLLLEGDHHLKLNLNLNLEGNLPLEGDLLGSWLTSG